MPTKTLRPLKKGDACYVRIHTGEIVEAVYADEPMTIGMHYVLCGSYRLLAVRDQPSITDCCRFVATTPELHARALNENSKR